MQTNTLDNLLSCPDYTVFRSEPMSEHTSFKIGGNAGYYVLPANAEAVGKLIGVCKESEVKTLYFGNGSNILFNDFGFDGVVISSAALTDIELRGDGVIACGSGVKNSVLCKFALENSFSGFEFLWGIPGTVGGAAFMNAGAYGSEICSVAVGCDYVDDSGDEKYISAEDMQLSYRHSVFSENGGFITRVYLKGVPAAKEQIQQKMDDLIERRRSKQPLEYPSAGSVFKRPEGYYAAALIEECGLKGVSVGGAQVSEKHSGFIINTGEATASDVKQLIEQIKKTVFLKTGVKLECEIRMV